MSKAVARLFKIVGSTVAAGSAATVSTYLLATRKTSIVTLSPDYQDLSPLFSKLNPRLNPVTSDIAIRRVDLRDLPVDLQDHIRNGSGAELTRRFCAGIWAGQGFEIQRRYLENKYRNLPGRHDQLWDREAMLQDKYTVGTKIVDHFEVVESQANKITVRCGDTPLNPDVRQSDGLFSMTTRYLTDTDEIEFRLISIFFNGAMDIMDQAEGQRHKGPMPRHVEFLHRIYTKIWMESSVRNLCAAQV